MLTSLRRGQSKVSQSEPLRPRGLLVRTVTWALYPLLAIGFAFALFSTQNSQVRLAILETIYLIPIIATVVLGAIAAMRSEAGESRYWTLISVANALLGACELMLIWWLVVISPIGPPPLMWPFQVMHLITGVCFVLLVLHMSRLNSEPLTTRARIWLDVIALGLITYAVILVVYARPIMTPVHPPVAAVLAGAGYALAACMMLFGTLGNIVGFKMVKWRSWEMLTAVAIGIYAIAVSMWPLWYTTVAGSSRNMERGLLDLIQFSGHYLLATAAVYRLTESTTWDLRPLAMPAVAKRVWVSAVLPALSVVAILVLGYAAISEREHPTWFTVFGVLAVALTVIVLARSLLLSLEHGRLFAESVTDPLTGLFNHRHFQDRLGAELDRAARYDEELAVIEFDLDDFGEFNSRFGHLEGDRLLAGLGSKLSTLLVGDAIAARLGGDEFAVLLPGHNARSAAVFTQHVLDVIGVECGTAPGELSASAGIAAYPEHGDTAIDLLHLADGALFHAKATGKARVVVYDAARVPDLSAHERIERLERSSRIAAVRALAAAVDARDPDTRFHAQRVASLSVRLANYLKLPDDDVRSLEVLALVHDVGQIAVSDAVLKKQGTLLGTEWHEMRAHPEHGQRILASTGLTDLVPAVRSHHERWDGTGYPDGLAGNEIPYEARLLALCDAYETMTADRTHRAALSEDVARAEIAAGAGSQFDPRLAEALLDMLDAESSESAPPESSACTLELEGVGVEVRLRAPALTGQLGA
jgi:diguanylate cyclase (GGDEF)-like protein